MSCFPHFRFRAIFLLLGLAIHPVFSQQCGKPKRDVLIEEHHALIRGGRTSAPGDFPWAAALYLKNGSGLWDQSCGGTLISHHLVLTAAHCVVLPGGREITAKDLMVKVGQVARDFYQNEAHSVEAIVKDIIVPDRYLGSVQYFAQDIALLDLNDSVPFSEYIRPACVELDGSVALKEGNKLFISGWGTNEDELAPPLMQWTTQTFIEFAACRKQLDDLRFITSDKFCVENNGETGAGKGDSGGGVTFEKDGLHYIMGVISTRLSNVRKILGTTSLTDLGQRDWLTNQKKKLHRVQWVNSHKGEVPPGAVYIGSDTDGTSFYVGRFFANHDQALDEVLPCIVNQKYGCKWTWAFKENFVDDYQVLVNENIAWVDYLDKDQVPYGSLAIGKTFRSYPYYVGRALHKDRMVPGKIDYGCLFIGVDGGEICKTSHLEILTLQPS